jgi:hypothetical protein
MMLHNKRLRRLAVVAVVVAAALMVGFGPGDDFETLVFEDNRPLTLTWDQAKDGVDVKVCNVGEARLQSLRAVLTGFNFQVNENLVADEAVLKQPPTITPWDAEKCTLVTIQTIKRPVPPAPGTYTGLVVISSPGAGMIRREVIIQVESATPEPTPVEGATGKLAFEDDSDLTLTWEQAKTGVNVNVYNDGNAPLQSLEAVLTGFNFLVDGETIADNEVLSSPEVDFSLDAHDRTEVRVQAADRATPDPGEYKGVLVVSAVKGDGTAERIRLNVTVERAPVECALEKIVLTATRYHLPSLRTVRLDNHYLPLKPAGPGETLLPPKEKDTHIGIVDNEGRLGRVYVDGLVKKEEVDVLLVHIEGLEDVGTYSGKLDMTGTGDAEQAISIEVKVTDHIGYAIFTILLGVLIPLGVLVYKQRYRLKSNLNERRNLLETEYVKAQEQFLKVYGKDQFSFNGYRRPSDEAIQAYQKGFDEALSAYAEDNWVFDTTSEDFKKVTETLETAENDAKLFGNLEVNKSLFGESLENLQTALKGLEEFLPEFPRDRDPAIAKSAASWLKGRPLKVGEAQDIKDKADEYVKLIDHWRQMAAEVTRYLNWIRKLEKQADMEPWDDQEMLRWASAKVMEAKNEMLDVKDAAMLASLGTDEDLRLAYGTLAFLGGRYKVWEPPQEKKSKAQRDKEAEEMQDDWGERPPAAENTGFEVWFRDSKPFSIAPAEAAKIERAIRWLGDAGVLVVAVSVALVAGLTHLYFDKTFGTLANYLSAILLGAGTQTALEGLKETIKQMK